MMMPTMVRMDEAEVLTIVAAQLMSGMEAAAEIARDAERDAWRDALACLHDATRHIAEGEPIDPLHDEERNIVVDADVIEMNDVRMIDRGSEACLFDEHAADTRITRELWRHGLHRVEGVGLAQWMSKPNRAHAPFAEHLHELVPTDPLAVRDTAHLPNGDVYRASRQAFPPLLEGTRSFPYVGCGRRL